MVHIEFYTQTTSFEADPLIAGHDALSISLTTLLTSLRLHRFLFRVHTIRRRVPAVSRAVFRKINTLDNWKL